MTTKGTLENDQPDADSAQNLRPQAPCSEPEARQFDFWIGEWDLTWEAGGRGTNLVQTVLNDCIIMEQFETFDEDSFQGLSLSRHNPRREVWQQTWVDNAGNYLDFEGRFEDEVMTLARETEVDGQPIRQRMIWYNISADELDWNWERSEDGGRTWKLLWQIHYRRRNSSQS